MSTVAEVLPQQWEREVIPQKEKWSGILVELQQLKWWMSLTYSSYHPNNCNEWWQEKPGGLQTERPNLHPLVLNTGQRDKVTFIYQLDGFNSQLNDLLRSSHPLTILIHFKAVRRMSAVPLNYFFDLHDKWSPEGTHTDMSFYICAGLKWCSQETGNARDRNQRVPAERTHWVIHHCAIKRSRTKCFKGVLPVL